jgi:predicted nucleic acid-binding protein
MSECLDTSVIVKCFKDNERLEDQANFIKDRISSMDLIVVINEWAQLELVRALVKAGFSKEAIQNASEYIDGLIELSVIQLVKVSDVKEMALKLQVKHSLHTGDAVHMATAIFASSICLWVDDKHFLKPEIKKTAMKHGVEIIDLKDLKM